MYQERATPILRRTNIDSFSTSFFEKHACVQNPHLSAHPRRSRLALARVHETAFYRRRLVFDPPLTRAHHAAAHFIRHFPPCPHGAPPEPGPLRCVRVPALAPHPPRPPPDATKPGAPSSRLRRRRQGARAIRRARGRDAARAGGGVSEHVSRRTARLAPRRAARDRAPPRVASASLTRAARRFLSPRARWLRRAVARNGRSRREK